MGWVSLLFCYAPVRVADIAGRLAALQKKKSIARDSGVHRSADFHRREPGQAQRSAWTHSFWRSDSAAELISQCVGGKLPRYDVPALHGMHIIHLASSGEDVSGSRPTFHAGNLLGYPREGGGWNDTSQ